EVLLAGVDVLARVVARGAPPPHADRPSPGTPLPRAPTTEKKPIPAEIPYLSAPAERLEKWRARMDGLARPRIALAWAGNPAHANDRHRSIPLARLAPLWSLDGPTFVSVQRDVTERDAGVLAGSPRLLHLGNELSDFADTAAVLTLVDLVISVDSAVAHLAGALGRPVWILLPFSPDWRWMLGRDDSPWYPTAKL